MPRSCLAAVLLAASLLAITNCASNNSSQTTPPPPPVGALSLLTTSLFFGYVIVGQSSSAQTVTLRDTGTAAVALSSITLTGPDASAFTETTTCGVSLAAGATCTIAVVFTSAAQINCCVAFINITNNVPYAQRTLLVTLNGSATTASTSYTLYTFPEFDNSITPLYSLISRAQKTVDITMYALEDTTFTNDLVADCQRGVVVRVILDQNDEKSGNTAAFNALNAQTNCSAVWANTAFEATHQKSIIIDASLSGAPTAIMTLNLQSQYYSTTRDFAMVENDPVDIAAIEETFNADYAAGTPSSGTAGASDFSYVPGIGDDLIWSPTTAQTAMVNNVANAKKTLLIENEELASSASYILSALETACQNGVQVQLAIVDQSDYESNFTALDTACGAKAVHVYPDTTTGFYIHAKAVVADYGLPTQSVYMGSINYSNASMNDNRELGMYITDPASIATLYTTMSADYAGGTAY